MRILVELIDDLEEGLNVGAIGDVQGVFAATFVGPIQESMVQIDRGEVVVERNALTALVDSKLNCNVKHNTSAPLVLSEIYHDTL